MRSYDIFFSVCLVHCSFLLAGSISDLNLVFTNINPLLAVLGMDWQHVPDDRGALVYSNQSKPHSHRMNNTNCCMSIY